MNKHTRYAVLDALRGVAAFAVLSYHTTMGLGLQLSPPGGDMAVDFFFILSGFIVANAYEQSLLTGMRFGTFIKIRLIRLYPLAFLSIIFVLAAWCMFELAGNFDISYYASLSDRQRYLSVLSALLIMPDIATPQFDLFFINPPAWSLWLELVINFFYGGFIRLLSTKILWLIAGAAFLLLIHLSFETRSFAASELYSIRILRVFFAFPVGVLICRFLKNRPLIKLPKISGWLLALFLAASFFVKTTNFQWQFEICCVCVLYPLIIIMATTDALQPRFVPMAKWLGRISYPIYILHWPVIFNVVWLMNRYHQPPVESAIVMIVAVLAVSIAALEFFDEPVRAWLHVRLDPALAHQASKP